jgi:hypothetical protein
MLTASGRAFDPKCLAAGMMIEAVCLPDVAHSLGQICRFGGHCKRHYSVAEHSLFVADIMRSRGIPAAGQIAGLLHDAHEAYCGDMPMPIKRALGEPWREFESGVEKAVHAALGASALMETWQVAVHDADLCALVTEIRALFLVPADSEARIRALGLDHVEPHSAAPGAATPCAGLAQRFLERYHTLRQDILGRWPDSRQER